MLRKLSPKALLAVEIGLLLLIAILTYYPNLRQATIYRDDWYYTLDRYLGGPDAFHEMFRIDRPARGFFFEAYYQAFGVEPQPFHLVGLAWRLLAGLAGYWLFRLLFPHNRQAAWVMAALFTLYPGYTRWMEGYENQPNVASLLFEALSIILSLYAVKARRTLPKILLWAAAILSGWAYVALVDYAVGIEAFRFLCLFVSMQHDQPTRSWRQAGAASLWAGLPALLVAGGYLFWQLFLFNNQRTETDLGLQLGLALQSPLLGAGWWAVNWLKSVVNTAVLAWAAPSFHELFAFSLTEIATSLLVAAGALLLALLALWAVPDRPGEAEDAAPGGSAWQNSAMLIGLLGVGGAVLPVVLVNRSVSFGAFSHYATPASLAAAVFAGGLVYTIANPFARRAAVGGLLLLAVLTQQIASNQVVREEQIISAFWQQVAWRAPGLRPGTTLLVNYPTINFGEDVDAVNGPANFIYFPTPSNSLPVRYPLYALKQYPWTAKEFLAGGQVVVGYRTHDGVLDDGKLLALSQPSRSACVHVIDRDYAWFSYDDPDTFMVAAASSDPNRILTEGQPPALSPTIFGPEPAHGWCYYFQRAELAAQQGDWQRVAELGAEALQHNQRPIERLEWLPFARAYAMLGDEQALNEAAARINETPYNRRQACLVLTGPGLAAAELTPAVRQAIDRLFCSQ